MKKTGAGVAALRGQEVLLVRRQDNGLWDIPGGGKRLLETPAMAARRELKEETGLAVKSLHKLGVWTNQHRYPDGNTVEWTTHVVTAAYQQGEARAADDASEVRWWPLSALPGEVSEVTARYFAALQHHAGQL